MFGFVSAYSMTSIVDDQRYNFLKSNGAARTSPQFSLKQLTFVDIILLLIVFDIPAVRGKFSCKNTPKFTARPELGRIAPTLRAHLVSANANCSRAGTALATRALP
jgi:hypothetical protein